MRRKYRALAGTAVPAVTLLLASSSAAQAASFEVETMSLPTAAGYVLADSAASGGKAFKFLGQGVATEQISVSAGATKLVLRARGDSCSGAPVATVAVDGTERLRAAVASATYADYAVAVNLTGGTHSVEVSFVNDLRTPSCDRNLFADTIRLDGGPATTPAPPAPPPAPALPAAGSVLFDAAFDNGLSPPWGGIQHCPDKGNAATRVTSPVSHGAFAMRARVTAVCSFGSQRAEIYKAGPDYTEGQERYFGHSIYYPSDFPATEQLWCNNMQLHTKLRGQRGEFSAFSVNCKDDRSNQTLIRAQSNAAGSEGSCQFRTPMVRGIWHHFVWRVKFSARNGNWDLWYGTGSSPTYRKVVSGCATNSLLSTSDRAYLKLGLYRGNSRSREMTTYHDNAKIGTSFAAVAP